MKKPSDQSQGQQSENITQRHPKSGSEKWGQPDSKFGEKFGQIFGTKRDIKRAKTQDPKQAANKRPPTLNDAEDIPMVAANGDDDLMSQKQPPQRQQPEQQPQGMTSGDQMKGKWKQQVGAAKVAWGKLTEDELLMSEGHTQKLSGLVQQRYAVTRDEADKQVRKFMSSNN